MGRAMSSLWGTFVVLFIAMYTAKLSSILVAQDADVSSSGKIQSMADVRDFGGGRILTFTGRDIGTGREPKGPGIEGEKRPGPEYPGIEKRPSPESEDGFESTEDAEKG